VPTESHLAYPLRLGSTSLWLHVVGMRLSGNSSKFERPLTLEGVQHFDHQKLEAADAAPTSLQYEQDAGWSSQGNLRT
jgi:hypothetical protein